MTNSYIITPYFFDTHLPQLSTLKFDPHIINDKIIADEKLQTRITSLYPPIADFVHQSVKCGQRPISIAGDCCATIPVVAGLQRAGIDPSIIWIDAHGDFNTWDTSPSGFLGGMPLAMIAGIGDLSLCDTVGLAPVKEEKIILTDARDLDPGERDLVGNSAVTHVRDIKALTSLNLPEGPLYVHFDTDIINSQEAPAFNYPVPGGPSADDVATVLTYLNKTGNVVAASMSAWTPALDLDGKTAEKCQMAFRALVN